MRNTTGAIGFRLLLRGRLWTSKSGERRKVVSRRCQGENAPALTDGGVTASRESLQAQSEHIPVSVVVVGLEQMITGTNMRDELGVFFDPSPGISDERMGNQKVERRPDSYLASQSVDSVRGRISIGGRRREG